MIKIKSELSKQLTTIEVHGDLKTLITELCVATDMTIDQIANEAKVDAGDLRDVVLKSIHQANEEAPPGNDGAKTEQVVTSVN